MRSANIIRDIPYTPSSDPQRSLDVWLPVADGGDAPLVVFLHGGGYFSGDKADKRSSDIETVLSALGFAVASVNYRLADSFGNRFRAFPSNVCDVAEAIAYLATNAEDYRYDATRIALMGCSAGATLASLYVLGGVDMLRAFGSDAPHYPVGCLVSFYGPFDYRPRPPVRRPESDGLAERISPAYWLERAVTDKLVPVMSIHGDQDEITPIDQHYRFERAYLERRTSFLPVVVQGFGHAFSIRDQNSDGLSIDLSGQVAGFLRSHLGV